MRAVQLLLVVPALAALAMPVVERNADTEAVHPDFWKRDDATVHPDFWKRDTEAVHPDFWKRDDAAVHPDFWKRAVDAVRPLFWKRDEGAVHPDFWKRDTEAVHPDFWKRDDAAVHPDFWKRAVDAVRPLFWKRDTETVQPEFWKREKEAVHPLFWRDMPAKERSLHWHRRAAEQPGIPSFIDTGACICGLLQQESTFPVNGEIIEMWRCEANLSESVADGSHGKWYNTTLPSQELSGIGQARNWGGNPPWTKEAFVLVHPDDNTAYYSLINSTDPSPWLVGNDTKCTAHNDTTATEAFYASQ